MKKPDTGQEDKSSVPTTKKLVWLCLGNGVAWVWCSYLLAYMGRSEIAEGLSKSAVTEIIGVVLVYAVKSLAENLSKNNTWPDRTDSAPKEKNIKRDC
jgi:hypothetical protein